MIILIVILVCVGGICLCACIVCAVMGTGCLATCSWLSMRPKKKAVEEQQVLIAPPAPIMQIPQPQPYGANPYYPVQYGAVGHNQV